MAEDWAADVKKYVPDADDNAIAGIIRYCGIALTKRDSSLVSFSDKTETDRVRNNFLKKKLARTEADSVLDEAIAAVGETLKGDRTKNRVTVYYLLADKFDSLGLFLKASNAKAKAPAKAAGAAADKKPAAKAAPKTAATGEGKTKAAGAAAAGGAALGLAALGGSGEAKAAPVSAAPTKAPETASAAAPQAAPAAAEDGIGTKAAVALGATGAAVVGAAAAVTAGAANAADKAGDVLGNAAGAAADTASKAGAAVVDAAGAAADTAGKAGAAVVGAAGAAAVGAAALAGKAGDTVSGAVSGIGSSVSGAAAGLMGGDDEDGSGNWLWWLLLGTLALVAIYWFFLRGPAKTDVAAGTATEAAATAAASGGATDSATGAAGDLAAAPAEGSVTIPTGAGVTSELRDGKPVVKVYFDTGKTAVAPAFTPAAGGLKAYLDSHAGSALTVSGFADPTGNAALNERLSKQRAEAVQAQLVANGVPAAAIALVKPESATDATVDKAAARRVEVVVK